MATFILPTDITADMLVEFDLFTVRDAAAVNTLKLVKDLEASDLIINTIIRTVGWTGYTYTDNDGIQRIGYGTTKNLDSIGLTERNSYNDWITEFKVVERKFKRVLPVDQLTQTQYDALLSLYYYTGTIAYVGSDFRRFEILDYIKTNKWDYLATALVNSGNKRLQRQIEARIMMLGDYGYYKTRTDLKEVGIQDMRSKYPIQLNDNQKKQAEYVYYVETKRFLPNMTDTRKRQIVKLYNENN